VSGSGAQPLQWLSATKVRCSDAQFPFPPNISPPPQTPNSNHYQFVNQLARHTLQNGSMRGLMRGIGTCFDTIWKPKHSLHFIPASLTIPCHYAFDLKRSLVFTVP